MEPMYEIKVRHTLNVCVFLYFNAFANDHSTSSMQLFLNTVNVIYCTLLFQIGPDVKLKSMVKSVNLSTPTIWYGQV